MAFPRFVRDVQHDSAGLPSADARLERIGGVLAILACVWVTLAAFWGVDTPASAGHFSVNAAIGMGADNMLRWKTYFPTSYYMGHPPTTDEYYTHHPFGIYWLAAAATKMFGRHLWVIRAIPALETSLSGVLLWRIGRAAWGPLEGALAAVVFGALPITLIYANLYNLEVPLIFGWLLATWGYLRLLQTSRIHYAALAFLGVVFSVHQDWEGFLWAGVLLAFAFARIVYPTRCRPKLFATWWGVTTAGVALSLLFYLYAIQSTGRLDELLGAHAARAGDTGAPFSALITERQTWISETFTMIGVAVGEYGLAIILGRLLVLRRDAEVTILAIFGAAYFQYVHFKQGADVHVFWPHPFAPYVALAAGAILATIRGVGSKLLERARRPTWVRTFALVSLGVCLVPALLMLRMAIPLMKYGRSTGGTLTEKSAQRVERDTAVVVAVKWFAADHLGPGEPASFHTSHGPYWHLQWELGDRPILAGQPSEAAKGANFFLLDSYGTPEAELRKYVASHHVHAVDNLWFVDGREGSAPLDAYVIDERRPTLVEWYFHEGGVEPMRAIRPDAWRRWELMDTYGSDAIEPSGEPRTFDQLRVAYNLALRHGDSPRAESLFSKLDLETNLKMGVHYANGMELIGARTELWSQPRVTLLFRAGRPGGNFQFSVHGTIRAKPRLWFDPVDPANLDATVPFLVAPNLWKEGSLYAVTLHLQRRYGEEVYTGECSSTDGTPAPRRVDGREPTELLVLR